MERMSQPDGIIARNEDPSFFGTLLGEFRILFFPFFRTPDEGESEAPDEPEDRPDRYKLY